MKLYKTGTAIIIEHEDKFYTSPETDWDNLINRDHLFAALQQEIQKLSVSGDQEWFATQRLAAPIGTQEVWAAGVTYLRSKVARMEESQESGGATFYDKVYDAERPELFFKSTAGRVVPTGGYVRIRKDSTWNVPEPELTLVINAVGKVVGYTIGNDMSSRSIEGENPLYLPQAKVYDKSASLGPCVVVPEQPLPSSTEISMQIVRNGEQMFDGNTTIDQMKRGHDELVEFLYREMSFQNGCYLMTGTCVVPGNEFTLQQGDEITISITGIGMLVNIVE